MSQRTPHSKGASFTWTCLVLVLACALLKPTVMAGQGLTTSELIEPLGPLQKNNVADMFNTNPNRLYDDFDGNTIYHKFHPLDDYVPPLPLTTPNAILTSGGTVQAFPTAARAKTIRARGTNSTSLLSDSGFDSNAHARKPPGPIAYHYDIIHSRGRGRGRARSRASPIRPPPPKTPPSPITISSSSSPEPDNDIVKRQIPTSSADSAPTSAAAPAAATGGQIQQTQNRAATAPSPKYPRYEVYRSPAVDGEESLPAFEVLQPGRTAGFIPLKMTPSPTSGPGPDRAPYNGYGIFSSIPNAMSRIYNNIPIFIPVNNNPGAARQWAPQSRPVYLPDPPPPAPAPPPVQQSPRSRPRAVVARIRPNSRQTRAVQGGSPFQRRQVAVYEPRPGLIGRQLIFPRPIAINYNNNAPMPMQLLPPPSYAGVPTRTPHPPYAGWKLTPQSGMTGNQGYGYQGRPPPPSYGQLLSACAAGPPQQGALIDPRTRYPVSPYLPPSNPVAVVSHSPRNWSPYVPNVDVHLMPSPPSYASSVGVRPFRPYVPSSTGPYYNQSPRMGYFLPPTNPGGPAPFVGGRRPQPKMAFIKTETQEPEWQGFGQGPPPAFDADQRPRPAPYYIPNQALYTAPPTGFGYPNAQPGTSQQPQPPAASGRQYGRNSNEAPLAHWTGSTAVRTNQPVQFAAVQPNVQPIPIPTGQLSTNTASAANNFVYTNAAGPGASQPSMGTGNSNSGVRFVGPSFNNSRPGVSNPTGLRAEQEPVEPQRPSPDPKDQKVPNLSVNRGPVPFYSQADVDGHYRRVLAHNETPADSEFENDPRVLQWYFQRAKQVLQDRGRQAQAASAAGSRGGAGNSNNAQSNANSVQPGGAGAGQLPIQSIPGPSTSGGQPIANENPAIPNQQIVEGPRTPTEHSGFLQATPPANRFDKK